MVLETQAGFFVGSLFIYYYGIVYAAAALSLYFVLLKKRHIIELSETQIDTFLISALMGLLIGARIFHFLINDPIIFISNPIQLFLIRQGGMSFFGAVIGVLSGTGIWYRYYKKNNYLGINKKNSNSENQYPKMTSKKFLRVLDYGSVVISIALIFGRFANFLNQELLGRVADPKVISWCIEFATAPGCRHPYQLYAAMSHLLLAIIVIIVINKSIKPGMAIATFFTMYGFFRFITDFWRDDAIVFMGLTVWQIFAFVLTVVGAIMLHKLYLHNTKEHKD